MDGGKEVTIQDLKKHVEDGSVMKDKLIIAVLPKSKNTFIINQYLSKISVDSHIDIEVTDTVPPPIDPFSLDTPSLWKYRCEEFNYSKTDLLDRIPQDSLLVVVTELVDKDTKRIYNNYIVEIPELEDNQIRDYAYSRLNGVDRCKIDWLLSITKHDIYRVDQEASKIESFNPEERETIFSRCISEGMYDNLSLYNIFNFTNAIIIKDLNKLKIILSEIENCDVEPTGLITILNNNFRNMVMIQLDSRATADSLGMNPKQFSAIKYNCGRYTSNQLISAYKFITHLDYMLKSGELPVDLIVDYALIHLLTL